MDQAWRGRRRNRGRRGDRREQGIQGAQGRSQRWRATLQHRRQPTPRDAGRPKFVSSTSHEKGKRKKAKGKRKKGRKTQLPEFHKPRPTQAETSYQPPSRRKSGRRFS